ncbi:protein esaC [Staphylococcus epidermidis]|uniref:protein esaC n=1 Tax=Staphylococcus epidermidis TaxID=1282 RepID=UPI00187A2707|nr:protein esaC [Staphylococcus epidermidis]MBE7320016.1 protein esaC [Staphylococcus epidermidis]
MEFGDIESIVKSKFKDRKKHAEEIASEIAERTVYLRKANKYNKLANNLEACVKAVDANLDAMNSAKSSSTKDRVSIKNKAPNTLYIEKRDQMKKQLEILTDSTKDNKDNLKKAKEKAEEKAKEYYNKAFH